MSSGCAGSGWSHMLPFIQWRRHKIEYHVQKFIPTIEKSVFSSVNSSSQFPIDIKVLWQHPNCNPKLLT